MATVQYDDILLNIRSAMSADGIDKAIAKLKAIKGVFPIEGLSESASDMQAFANAINSINSDTLRTISSMKRRLKGITGGLTINQQMPSPAVDEATKIDVGAPDAEALAQNAEKAREGLNEASESAQNLSTNMNSASKHSTTLLGKLEQIARYRMLRAVITGMVNAMKEGVGNLEAWDRRVGNTGFADAMDRARESLLVLKNSLAVVSAPFIEILIKGLQQIASWAMTAANAISRFFAILGDQPTYRAVIWADTIAESEKKAGGAAKKATEEFKKQLLAFDEINNITAQNPSGSGGGGSSGGGGGYTDMFGERSVGQVSNVAKAFQAIIDKIKQVAKELQPVLNKLKDIATEIAKPAWEGFKRVLESVAGLFINIVDLCGSMVDALGRVVIGIDKATQAFGGLKTIGLLLKEAFDKLAFVIDIVSAGIRVLSYVVEVAGYYFEHIGDVVGHFLNLLARKESFEEFKSNLRSSADELQGRVKKAVNDLKYDLDRTFNHTYTLTTKWDEIINRTIHVNEVRTAIQGKGYRTNELYASGGFPTQGQMFIAREAGPELVGTIGGQTAVVNNSDIVASVSQGVAQAVASVLGGGQQVNVTLEGDAKNLFKVVQREGRAYSARTGQPALA